MGTTPSKPLLVRPPAVDPATALLYLKQLERSNLIKILLFFLFGIPLSFLAPFVAGGIYWPFCMRFRIIPPPWWSTIYPYSCSIAIPTMYLLAWITKGSLTNAAIEDVDSDWSIPYHHKGGGRFADLIILDILLVAPRTVIHAGRLWHARATVGPVDLPRIAESLAALASEEESLPPAQLLKPDEFADALDRIFPLLLFHDQIGISKAGDKIWVLSPVREKLLALKSQR